MIDVSKHNNKATLIDDAATNVGSVIRILEESLDYLNCNDSNKVDSFKSDIESKLMLLKQIQRDLTNAASTIRTKATQIYNEQKAAEEARLKAEEEARLKAEKETNN